MQEGNTFTQALVRIQDAFSHLRGAKLWRLNLVAMEFTVTSDPELVWACLRLNRCQPGCCNANSLPGGSWQLWRKPGGCVDTDTLVRGRLQLQMSCATLCAQAKDIMITQNLPKSKLHELTRQGPTSGWAYHRA